MRENDAANMVIAEPAGYRRRSILISIASIITAATGISTVLRRREWRSLDTDRDGIPDSLEYSPRFHRQLETIFEAEIDALNPHRRDLLIDVRYLGEMSLSEETKRYLRELFSENGIYLQWLEYPGRYDPAVLFDRYGSDVEGLLVEPDGFYWDHVDPLLRRSAFQLLVLPHSQPVSQNGKIYSSFYDDDVNGMNVGNRAAVSQRDDPFDEAKLVLHEIAHLVLCHDSNPDNLGVMGQEREVDLTDREWDHFRNGLSNIRDSTGIGVVSRRCLIDEHIDTGQ